MRGEVAAPRPTKAVEESTPAEAAEPAAAGDPTKGAEIFAANCIACHGPDAAGSALGPTLVSIEVATNDDDFFRYAITNGRRGTAMPPWSGVLPPQDIADIIGFLRSKQ